MEYTAMLMKADGYIRSDEVMRRGTNVGWSKEATLKESSLHENDAHELLYIFRLIAIQQSEYSMAFQSLHIQLLHKSLPRTS